MHHARHWMVIVYFQMDIPFLLNKVIRSYKKYLHGYRSYGHKNIARFNSRCSVDIVQIFIMLFVITTSEINLWLLLFACIDFCILLVASFKLLCHLLIYCPFPIRSLLDYCRHILTISLLFLEYLE